MNSQASIHRRATFLVALAGFVAVSAVVCIATVLKTGGTLTYVLDDTYIHLAMARNFADYLSWGMVPHVFEASSSSPGWVLLVAGFFKLFQPLGEWWPLIINASAAAGVIAIFAWKQDLIVIRRSSSPLGVAAVFILPSLLFLPALLLVGMEHTLHTLIVLLLFLQTARLLRESDNQRSLAVYALLLLAATALRFESAFLAFGLGMVLLYKRHFIAFVISGIVPAAVIGLDGWINLAHGRYFLPNSIIEKSAVLGSNGIGSLIPHWQVFVQQVVSDQFLVVLLLFAVFAIIRGVSLRPLWIAWAIAALLHCTYAQVGWFDRYQAYLVISGVFLLFRSYGEVELVSQQIKAAVLAIILILIPVPKYSLIAAAPLWAQSQYLVQNQVGRFMAQYYQGQAVMTEDIGHVTWEHSQGGLLDMWALADFDVLKSQMGHYWNADYMTQLAQQDNVRVLAEYTPEFDFLVPHGFVKVAVWPLPDPDKGVAEAVVWWAPDEQSAQAMRRQMREFIPTLPAGDTGYIIQ